MREQCSKHGEFKRNADGTLEFDSWLALRGVILRQAARLFKPKRAELDAAKLEAFHTRNDGQYIKIFREGQQASQQAHMVMTSKACEHIELSGKDYGQSSQTWMADKAKARQIQMGDAAAVRGLGPPLPDADEETAIKAY